MRNINSYTTSVFTPEKLVGTEMSESTLSPSSSETPKKRLLASSWNDGNNDTISSSYNDGYFDVEGNKTKLELSHLKSLLCADDCGPEKFAYWFKELLECTKEDALKRFARKVSYIALHAMRKYSSKSDVTYLCLRGLNTLYPAFPQDPIRIIKVTLKAMREFHTCNGIQEEGWHLMEFIIGKYSRRQNVFICFSEEGGISHFFDWCDFIVVQNDSAICTLRYMYSIARHHYKSLGGRKNKSTSKSLVYLHARLVQLRLKGIEFL
jgi:hypothetical protein